ncbi:unnamed protein product [marine sediment metagenome]|uniref:Uncharacterized protein n=1 Tax=marine sediment metagenome TaxID=412755 RepID=X1C695_9ZZZZ
MASPFSSMLIFLMDRGKRAMYWERASRVLEDPAGMRTEAIHTESRMPPIDQAGGYLGADKLFL